MIIYGIGQNKNVSCGMGDSVNIKTLAIKECYTGGHFPLFTDKEEAEKLCKELQQSWIGKYIVIELTLKESN